MYDQILRYIKVMIGHKYIYGHYWTVYFYALFSPVPALFLESIMYQCESEVCKNTLLCYEAYLCGYFLS